MQEFDKLPEGDRALIEHRPRIRAVAAAAKIVAMPVEDEDAPGWLRLVSAVHGPELPDGTWVRSLPPVERKISDLVGLFRTWDGVKRNCAALRAVGQSDATKTLWNLLEKTEWLGNRNLKVERRCVRIAVFARKVQIDDPGTIVEFAHAYHMLTRSEDRNCAREWPETVAAIKAVVEAARVPPHPDHFLARLDPAYQDAARFILNQHSRSLRAALVAPDELAGDGKRDREFGDTDSPAPKIRRTEDGVEPAAAVAEPSSSVIGFELGGSEPGWRFHEQVLCAICHDHCLIYGSLLAEELSLLPGMCAVCKMTVHEGKGAASAAVREHVPQVLLPPLLRRRYRPQLSGSRCCRGRLRPLWPCHRPTCLSGARRGNAYFGEVTLTRSLQTSVGSGRVPADAHAGSHDATANVV
ncbi:hypothetical protein AB0M48_38615 [Lentzea sp. NPDC051208]|uniref:hypothetical protein n=1 Tax=Lentzea sp. NPDC051208 TaxID=3154642 RepID=UPI003427F6BD